MPFQKTIVLAGLGVALLLIAYSFSAVFTRSPGSLNGAGETLPPAGSASESRPLAGNAFLDSDGIGGAASSEHLAPEKLPEQAPLDGSALRESFAVPNAIEKIGESVSRILSPAPETLPLPPVSDSEIAVDQGGAQSPIEYFEYLVLHYREIPFDYFRLNAFIDKEAGDYPSPPEFIGRYLADGTPPPEHSLETWRELAQAKIEFERRVKVSPRVAGTSKAMIGLDRLAIALIDAFGDFRQGRMSRNEFESLYEKYNATEKAQFTVFAGDAGLVRADSGDTLLSRALEAVGLRKTARALGLTTPFGGPVIYKTICSCSAGSAIIVGPPRPGAFFLPVVYGLFAYYRPSIGHLVLSIAARAPIPCMQGIPPGCVPDAKIPGTEGPVIIMGTSD